MNKRIENYSVILIILLFGLLFQHRYLNEFPSHIHAWAQSDRYALALGFVDNNLDFFHPQTFVKNHQFPDDWKVPSNTSITAVDFPLHDYIPAIVMKLSGNHSPFIFRIYILLYSFLGLFFLFKLARCLTKDFYKSLFLVIFAATSSVFIYYQAGFLPTVPSLSNAIIGLYFYVKYIRTKQDRHFILSMLFLTLATLSRTTFAIPLVAVWGTEFLRIIRKQTLLRVKVLPIVFSIAFILGYYFYNGFLTKKYGSIFLAQLLFPSDFESAVSIVKAAWEHWGIQYFSVLHYIVFVVLAITVIFVFAGSRNSQIKGEFKNEWILLGLLFFGDLLFAAVMLPQFRHHDYYFLDTFFLPILLLLILVLTAMPTLNHKAKKVVVSILIVAIGALWLMNGMKTQLVRRITFPNDRVESAINNFTGAERFLDSIGISKDASLLVLTAPAPNLPFILMNRKGYVLMKPSRERIEAALEWPADYIVYQNEYFVTDIYGNDPSVIRKMEKVADNGKITVCRKANIETNNLSDFLQFDEKVLIQKQTINFDDAFTPDWENANITTLRSCSAPNSSLLDSTQVFGLTYRLSTANWLSENGAVLFVSTKIWHEALNDIELVVSITDENETIFYKPINIDKLLKKGMSWENLELTYILPKIDKNDAQLGIYFYNPGKNRVSIDDFSFQIYRD